MSIDTANRGRRYRNDQLQHSNAVPGLLLAHSISPSTCGDRFALADIFSIGRHEDCSLSIPTDSHLSGKHLVISRNNNKWILNDLNSSNGTYLNGEEVTHEVELTNSSVICAGNCIFVFLTDARKVLHPPANQYGLYGSFHNEGLLTELREAVSSGRHILLAGPSGSGKEVTAKVFAQMFGTPTKPMELKIVNSAKYQTVDLANMTFFGSEKGVFSNVNANMGIIESSQNRMLFFDEIHNLEFNIQRMLLRAIENGEYSRSGNDINPKVTNAMFVFSSNDDSKFHGLAPDMFARFLLIKILCLKERIADIPAIFDSFLETAVQKYKLNSATRMSIFQALDNEHYETMCLDGFPDDNVRGIIDITDKIGSKVFNGMPPLDAVDEVFLSRFPKSFMLQRNPDLPTIPAGKPNAPDGPIENTFDNRKNHVYSKYKNLILNVFLTEAGLKIATTQKILRDKYNIKTNRDTLQNKLSQWEGYVGEKGAAS